MQTFDPYHKWLGIPPGESAAGTLNHYRLLGLALFEADAEVIASAADQRMAHLRTFQAGPHSDLSQTLLNQVTSAKLCLLRPEKKAEYDSGLRRRIEPAVAQPAAAESVPTAASRAPLRRPLRIAAPLTLAENTLADSAGAELGSLGLLPENSRVVKKQRRAKAGSVPLAFWAPVAAVMAVLVAVWAASQSDSASPSNVAVQIAAESPAPRADASPAKPAMRVTATVHAPAQHNRSAPGSGIRENSGVAPSDVAPLQVDSPPAAARSELATDASTNPFAGTAVSPAGEVRAAGEVKPPVAPLPIIAEKKPAVATGKPVPLPNNAFVVSLAQDNAGNVWVGTEDLGVFRYDPSAAASAQWTEFTTRDGLGDDNAYALCVDRLNRVWVGHLNHGVSVYNGESWVNYDVPYGPIGERIFSIAADPKSGDVWIATSAGLTRYSLENDNWTHYTRDDGLPSDQIQSLAFDPRGTLYAGTQCDGMAISDPPPVVSHEALAAGQPASAHRRWRQIVGPDAVPLAPSGQGLPSNLINDVLVSRGGVVFVATTCGLAASKDRGKSWAFIRGADWGAKVKGLYGGPPRGWREGPAAFLLTEDYCTSVAEDDSGLLWIGHWRTGYEAIDPKTLQRFSSGGAAKTAAALHGYVRAILPLPGSPPQIGWYGNGMAEPDGVPTGGPVPAGAHQIAAQPAPLGTPNHPSPAGPPTLGELNAMLAKLGTVPLLRTERPCVVELPDDWRTEGDWLGRYGRWWACCCAICSPEDYIWGAGPEPVEYRAYIGPNHSQKNDTLRYWVHWLATDNPRSLEMPPTYLDSRIKRGETTREKSRRQAEWDDHGEAYSPTLDGPHVYCNIRVPAGQFNLSLYDFNKDGHDGDNCLRDYRISIRAHGGPISSRDAGNFDREPELACGRLSDFWGGVWKRYYVQGPIDLTVRLSRSGSKNTILAGLALGCVEERPVPYFCTLAEWKTRMADMIAARAGLLAQLGPPRQARFAPRPDVASAANGLFDELDNERLRNAPWWAAESRRYYAPLARLYAVSGVIAGKAGARRRLAACCYHQDWFAQWESLQRAEGLVPARDIEHALRWDGYAITNSAFGFQNVVRYRWRGQHAAPD